MSHHFLLLAGTLLLLTWEAVAGAQSMREYQVKGAFLANFARFIEWSPQAFERPDGPLTICFRGEDWIVGELDSAIRNRRVGGRDLQLKRVKDTSHCHLLYISATEPLDASLRKAAPFTVTVGEHGDFLKAGGHIRLFFDGDQIRFSIAPGVVHSRHYQFSSHLLALADSFKRKPVE